MITQQWFLCNIIHTSNFASEVNYSSTIAYSLKHSADIISNDDIMLEIQEWQIFFFGV